MKAILILAYMLAAGLPLAAQHQSSTEPPVVADKGFIALTVSPTRLNGSTGLMLGAALYGVVGRHLGVGLMGAGLINNVQGKGSTAATRRNLTLAYCGIYSEFVINPESDIRVAPHMFLGAGGLAYHGPYTEPRTGAAKNGGIDIDLEIDRETDAFLIAEPGANVAIPLAQNVRLGAGLSYRFMYGVETDGISDGTASGPVLTFMARFGVF